MSAHYTYLWQKRKVTRQCIVFSPSACKASYNPYSLLDKDDPNFVQYVREIAYAIIPLPNDVKDPYWINMARDLLSAAIVYYFSKGWDFIETIMRIQKISAADLCEEIQEYGSNIAKMLINEIGGLKSQQISNIASEMKRHTMVFATDPEIQDALSHNENGGIDFSWQTLTDHPKQPNIFLKLNQDKLEQWSGAVRLMLTQLIRHLERRPEKHSAEGYNTKPILILLDEFPALGKMDIIPNALATLRSKKVTFCPIIQSIAQLDCVYGENVRKIIMDNCQYKVMLNITEPDSQEYFSRLIGTRPALRGSASQSFNPYTEQYTWGRQLQQSREPLIYPHEFATNKDIWLHTPYGFLRLWRLPVDIAHIPYYKHNSVLQDNLKEIYGENYQDFY